MLLSSGSYIAILPELFTGIRKFTETYFSYCSVNQRNIYFKIYMNFVPVVNETTNTCSGKIAAGTFSVNKRKFFNSVSGVSKTGHKPV